MLKCDVRRCRRVDRVLVCVSNSAETDVTVGKIGTVNHRRRFFFKVGQKDWFIGRLGAFTEVPIVVVCNENAVLWIFHGRKVEGGFGVVLDPRRKVGKWWIFCASKRRSRRYSKFIMFMYVVSIVV